MSNKKVIKKFTKSPSINPTNPQNVIPQLVEKHNILASSHNSSVEQINGILNFIHRELDHLHGQKNNMGSQLKNLIFNMNKINIENEVLRKALYKAHITNPQIVKNAVDELMRQDLGVDSDLKPVGEFRITKYNC